MSDKELHSKAIDFQEVLDLMDIPEGAEIHEIHVMRGDIVVEWLEESND
jgi:hypothetical protein